MIRWLTSRGFTPAKCDANFVFVDIKRVVRPVIAAFYDKGVAVGRPFPPLGTHLCVSIGLQAEMDNALAVLGEVLGAEANLLLQAVDDTMRLTLTRRAQKESDVAPHSASSPQLV